MPSDTRTRFLLFLLALLWTLAAGCAGRGTDTRGEALEKIAFDLSQFNADGLRGPPDGLRALHYEFCIPADQQVADEVMAIDSTVQVFVEEKGRIRCSGEEFLCLGNTHQKNFEEVLLSLAALPYVRTIEETFFEQ
jgi:hypothetical protein